ncbi:MAG: DUF6438 domain-containing protein [Flavobacteriales bacterium]
MIRNPFIALVSICILAIAGCRNGKSSGTSKDEQVAIHDTVVVLSEAKVLEDSVFLLYSRTPCFGMCPVFELKVLKSGKAFYNGKNFTDRIGHYQSQWSDAALQRIQFVADSIQYFSFDEKYDNDHVTDLPSIHTALLYKGQMKVVANRYKGPKELHTLYKELDAWIEKSTWKPNANSSN